MADDSWQITNPTRVYGQMYPKIMIDNHESQPVMMVGKCQRCYTRLSTNMEYVQKHAYPK